MRVVTYDMDGNIISDVGTPIDPGKSIYTKKQILDKIPRAMRVQIAAQRDIGDDHATDFMFLLSSFDTFDLNDLPDGFEADLDGMAANENISLTQNQVNNFLER